MKTTEQTIRKTCSKCGAEYTGPSALSRSDSAMEICPECGYREAMASIGISKEEQEHILQLMAACKPE